MSRREARPVVVPLALSPPPPPSKCAKVLYYSWKLCSVLFAHLVMISLVVAYCILGAVTFERLEAQHEKEVKQNISFIRANTTHSIWSMTNATPVLMQANWTRDVADMLRDFENSILLEMKVRGWDGNESTDHIQWTFTGALFYSIIVITTIGYGHIAPKTQTGKVVTILYAILGIPLMLLCLSNIGDVMASSFRFLYWRVCCYVCTRPPKRHHRHHHQRHSNVRRSVRASMRTSSRRRRPTAAAAAAVMPPLSPSSSQLAPPPGLQRAHSDTECRYRDSGYGSGRGRRPRIPAPPAVPALRTRSQPATMRRSYKASSTRSERGATTRGLDGKQGGSHRDLPPAPDRSPNQYEAYDRDYDDIGATDEFPKVSLPLHDLEAALRDLEEHQQKLSIEMRSKSLPRPAKSKPDFGPRRHFHFGLYDLEEDDQKDLETHDLHDVDYENYKERKAREMEDRMKGDEYILREREREYEPEDDDYEFDQRRGSRRPWNHHDQRRYRCRSEYYERDWERPYVDAAQSRGQRARSAAAGSGYEWREGDDFEGRRRLRRLRTVDENARRPYRDTPSPDREEWSDEIVVPPRRRPAAWGPERLALYPDFDELPIKEELKPVPIWLCVVLVGSYIVAGTFLFRRWEGWSVLDAAYFCFITLTTIGFGDFVPAQGVNRGYSAGSADAAAAVHSLALCALYVLFGIALLAMAFNLVQEEVRANVAALATKLGIIKPKVEVDDFSLHY